ncbi:MAG TPA: SCO family protein [Rubricoccaceae bacterium]|nr:SCO family protein [Rubricoccaceae bacterium]
MNRALALLALALTLAACDAGPDVPAYDFDAPLPEASLYQVEAAWTSDAGTPAALADFRGTPVVLTMGYTSCGYACPMLVQDMKKIASSLPEGTPARFVLVSMDPERDTPEALRAFRAAHDLGDDWTLLTGSAADVRTLAALLGVRYRPEAGGAIAHSNVITVLDRDGVVAAQQEGLGADPGTAAAALQQALGR